MGDDDAAPLILTLALDDDSFARLDGLRREHFPAGRNLIPAHVTLFHHLPGAELAAVLDAVRAACRGRAPFAVKAGGLRFLGRGVAIELASPELSALRAGLARAWERWLTAQDRQAFRPHVTVQNKVTAEAARALHAALSAGFSPFEARAEGLDLWHYRGGPWESAGRYPFTG